MVPSCMRVPPEVGEARIGSRSAVARSMELTIRSAAAMQIEPARKSNSHAMITSRRPSSVPSPVITDSSTPDFSAARSSEASYPGTESTCAERNGAASQERNEPGSRTKSRICQAPVRAMSAIVR